MAKSINEMISAVPVGTAVELPAGELEGSIRIDRPVHLKGNNSTIWARHGAVLEIASPGVILENLRVEITEGDISETAVLSQYPTEIRNVEILGSAEGFGQEDGLAEIPRTLNLGELSPNGKNSFLMTVDIPATAEIVCGFSGIEFQPKTLPAGRTSVKITIEGSGSPGLIYTEVLLKSGFVRRIYLCGRFSAGAAPVTDKTVFEAQERNRSIPANAPSVVSASDVIANVGVPPLGTMPLLEIKRGQRIPAAKYLGSRFEIYFSCEKPQGLEIDPYVFLLDENERAVGENSLVFFGNTSSPGGAVTYFEDGHIEMELEKCPAQVKRIAFAYSVYSGDSFRNFSQVRNFRASVCAGGSERVVFPMDGLSGEVTIVAFEFYIYKDEWRMSAVGGGYREGLVRLCNHYGIEVE